MHNLGTELSARIPTLLNLAQEHDIDATIIGPGPDLEYFAQYQTPLLERISILVAMRGRDPFVLIPKMEEEGTKSSSIPALNIEVVTWEETEDPFQLLQAHLATCKTIAISDNLPARWLLGIQQVLPTARYVSAHPLISPMRERKSNEEVAGLRGAAQAIDEVHALVPTWLAPGISERDIAAKIQTAILAKHATIDFVIVGSGPNSSAPHHGYSDRVLKVGDPVVVDIGGTMPSGYCSDSTRTYHLGPPNPTFANHYRALQDAQAAAVAAVKPGISCETIDSVARNILTEAGIGDQFLHRTGHGIGLETHEDPYIVQGNQQLLEPGMAFSVEPGFYDAGKWGARIEDIVVCTEQGVEALNRRPHELVIIDY